METKPRPDSFSLLPSASPVQGCWWHPYVEGYFAVAYDEGARARFLKEEGGDTKCLVNAVVKAAKFS